MKQKVAVIGASYLQLPLVKKAKELGIETHCFAWEEDAICKDIADFFYPISIIEKDKILEKCKQIKIDGVLSIASDAAVPTVCYIADKLHLTANDIDSVENTTNKYLMRKKFIEQEVNSPKFIFAVDNNYALNGLNFPLIVKPTDRSGSRGVMKIESPDQLEPAILRARNESFSKTAIIEEYIDGSEVSVETISWQGQHFILAITDKVTTESPYFVELEHHQPSMLPMEIQDKIKKETLKALNALKINYGASHSEFKISKEGNVYVIEIGARMGGDFIGSDLVYLSTGYDFLKGVIDVALGNFKIPDLADKKFSGVYFLTEHTKEKVLPIILNKESDKNIIVGEMLQTYFRPHVECSADRNGYFIYQSEAKILL